MARLKANLQNPNYNYKPGNSYIIKNARITNIPESNGWFESMKKKRKYFCIFGIFYEKEVSGEFIKKNLRKLINFSKLN